MKDEHVALTDDQLAAIRQRVEATTEGEWRAVNNPALYGVSVRRKNANGTTYVLEWLADNVLTFPDTEFIAAAPADVRALLAEVERLRGEIKRIEGDLDWWVDEYDESRDT